MHYSPHLNLGKLEVYTGPMRSGKTREMINRIDKITHISSCSFSLIKPKIDTRDEQVKTRFGEFSFPCFFVDENNPKELLDVVKKKDNLIAIDEAHFFSKEIVGVVRELLKKDKNVLISGLDLDFRGETFGAMGDLLSMADEVYKQKAVCVYKNCGRAATRTQRLVDGAPAHYDSSLILIGDVEEGYEPRCIKHHFVPRD